MHNKVLRSFKLLSLKLLFKENKSRNICKILENKGIKVNSNDTYAKEYIYYEQRALKFIHCEKINETIQNIFYIKGFCRK